MISPAVQAKIRTLFAEQEYDVVVALLPRQLDAQPDELYERLLLSVLALSEGDISRLSYFVDRACTYPGDIAILSRYPRALGPMPAEMIRALRGGPVTVPDIDPHPGNRDNDLWTKNGAGAMLLCVVCGELVSHDFAGNPRVVLSRSSAGGGRARRKPVTVHPDCEATGRTLAAAQGYGWEVGGALNDGATDA
jgi:hypothetical protein